MKFDRLTVVLPCYSLEDLALDRPADEAQQLLSGWSTLFHPGLLLAAETIPRWCQVDSPPQDPATSLIVLPPCAEPRLPDGWLARVKAEGVAVIDGLSQREPMIAAALARLPGPPPEFDPLLVQDFLALGFCHFLVELLTRQLRYMSNLDESRFQDKLLSAAREAAQGQNDVAREHLHSAFDLLTEAREYFYPVEANLLDLTLVAPTTIGASLRAELARGGPINLLISGETVQRMAEREPETLTAVRQGLESDRVSIIGGEYDERELPLMTADAILEHLRRGLAVYEKHLGRRPEIFGRRRFGLTPLLPAILKKLGFIGCLHFTLDDGRFPSGNQSRVRWEGLDGTVIESLARLPLDAASSDNYLRLPERLGRAMDLDHAATAIFAHWPGQESAWYGDLRRMAEYSPAMGRFALATDYFRRTEYVGQATRYKTDQYRSPYLRQAVVAGQVDPLSRWTRYYARSARVESAQRLQFLAEAVTARGTTDATIDSLRVDIADSLVSPSGDAATLDRRLDEACQQSQERFLASLGSRPNAEAGYLLANPGSHPWTTPLDVSRLERLPTVGPAVSVAKEDDERKEVVVEVPSMGFAWVAAGEPVVEPPAKKGFFFRRKPVKPVEPPLVIGNVLRNEFIEMAVDPLTGGIKAIRAAEHRTNRLGQQLALRSPDAEREGRDAAPGAEANYSVMAADRIWVVSPGPVIGQVASRGRLLDRSGVVLARFVQTVTLARGSRLVDVAIELDIDQLPGDDPWDSYYASRFAWGDDALELQRGVGRTSDPTETAWLDTPHFVDIVVDAAHTTILTHGLPYHRRFGARRLDSLLIVKGETARKFQFTLGLDLRHPPAAADGILRPPLDRFQTTAPSSPLGWLFRMDARNVIATHWESLLVDGRVTGFRVRLLEVEGHGCQVRLRSFRRLASARKSDFGSLENVPLTVADDRVTLDLAAREWTEIEAEFA